MSTFGFRYGGNAMTAIVAAFTASQVASLTGLSLAQLRSWDSKGFFSPRCAFNDNSPFSKIYTFKDIVGLRTISVLKNVHKVSTRQLFEVAKKLEEYRPDLWSELKFSVWNRKITWLNPDSGAHENVIDGQAILFGIDSVINEMAEKISVLGKRTNEEVGRFEKKRNIAHNKEVFNGTRIPVQTIIEYLEEGYSEDEILSEYPSLKKEDIDAVRKDKSAA